MNLIPRDNLFDFDRLVSNIWGNTPTSVQESEGVFAPRVDVHEKDDAYVIKAELPGVDKDHLTVTLDKDRLSIDATMEEENEDEKDGKVIRRERRFGRFTRSFYVGEAVTDADIKASFKDGILNLEVQKKEPSEPVQRRITVN